MQVIFESLFDIGYLLFVIYIGIWMFRHAKGDRLFKLFGIMAIILGVGDAFHLVPRVYAMWTTGLEVNTALLGFGQFVTSLTMTVFYCILYEIYRLRYDVQNEKGVRAVIYGLAALRMFLCLCPQNQWLSPNAPLSWGILRNVPFAIIDLIMIVLFYRQAKAHHDLKFRFMWLAIVLSFAFYIPVVLWVHLYPMLGLLMIPKTCAYVWCVLMGKAAMKQA